MAKGKAATNAATDEDTESRSESIDVTDATQAKALAAAWRGVYHFFGGDVERWEISDPNPDSDDPDVRENGQLIVHGFTVDGDLGATPSQVIEDITKRERRLDFLSGYRMIVEGKEPPAFTDPQDMTNFAVLFLKGSVAEGTSKTPEYVRDAISGYKSDHGLASRRGPKRKIIRLDDLKSVDANTIKNIPKDQLDAFLALAQSVARENPEATGEEVSDAIDKVAAEVAS